MCPARPGRHPQRTRPPRRQRHAARPCWRSAIPAASHPPAHRQNAPGRSVIVACSCGVEPGRNRGIVADLDIACKCRDLREGAGILVHDRPVDRQLPGGELQARHRAGESSGSMRISASECVVVTTLVWPPAATSAAVPAFSVTPPVLMKRPPSTVMPLGLARMKCARWPTNLDGTVDEAPVCGGDLRQDGAGADQGVVQIHPGPRDREIGEGVAADLACADRRNIDCDRPSPAIATPGRRTAIRRDLCLRKRARHT